jgi:hypothetical protein
MGGQKGTDTEYYLSLEGHSIRYDSVLGPQPLFASCVLATRHPTVR